jgi:esterase/lipase
MTHLQSPHMSSMSSKINDQSPSSTTTSQQNNVNNQQQQQQHVITVTNDMNKIEIVFEMQAQLCNQQKELKKMETDTMDQLRTLYSNLNRLATKFDAFETVVQSQGNNLINNSQRQQLNSNIKSTKSSLNRINQSLSHSKVI